MRHRRATPVLVSLLIMCHALKILFHGFTAADVWLLIIELVVVALVADKGIRSWQHHRRARRLLDLISRGEDLRATVLTGSEPITLQEKWRSDVQEWMDDAATATRTCGPYAWKFFQRNQGRAAYLLPPINIAEANKDLHSSLTGQLQALEIILSDKRYTAGR